jgi:ornithine cyclodeaminase/alanine dehydrogenase-like protein (mu-crystallin family)
MDGGVVTLLITRREIAALMCPADYREAVQQAFAASGRGLIEAPPPLHLHGLAGGFHAKGAVLKGPRAYAAIKLNANFPNNPALGLATIQGVIALFDANNGVLLALMDSIEITLRRTGAATALAARNLARRDATIVTLCGCGQQAMAQLEALGEIATIAKVYAFDTDADKARSFAKASLIFPVEVARDLSTAARNSDIIVTCTTARMPFLACGDVKAGAFVAAIGADNPEKSEIAPALMAKAKVVVDALDQCVVMGDLHHAIEAGVMTRDDVYASLGDVIAGSVTTLPKPDDIVIFDSTGVALQDVSSAACVYERAIAAGIGAAIGLNLEGPQ